MDIEINSVDAEDSGLISSVQRFSLHDGPGIRTTIFMKGCSLKCEWCANPETMGLEPQLMTLLKKCTRCGRCITACPNEAIALTHEAIDVAWDKCDQCQKCVDACATGALETNGKRVSTEELMAEIASDREFYETSGGGVTFSGGEPLVQWKFVLQMLKRCKARRINTSLDTTGNVSWNILEQVLPYTDLVLYDVKHLDDEAHKAKTGIGNRMILRNLEKIARNARVWLRIPVIPGFNDSEQHLERVGRLAVELGAERVSLFPFHKWGEGKYERLGKAYLLSESVLPPKPEDLEKHRALLVGVGAEVSIGK